MILLIPGSCSGMLHMYDAVVKNILGFILEGLFEQEIVTSAALAMKTLSRDCTKNLSEFTPQILTSCKVIQTKLKKILGDFFKIIYSFSKHLRVEIFLPTTATESFFASEDFCHICQMIR